MGDPVKEYLPHGVTENEFLERLDPEKGGSRHCVYRLWGRPQKGIKIAPSNSLARTGAIQRRNT